MVFTLSSFSELLRCVRTRNINIMKVYIEKNKVGLQGELIRFRKNSDFIDFTNF